MFFPETLPVVPQLIWYGLKIIFLQNTLVSTEKLHHVTFPDRGVFFFFAAITKHKLGQKTGKQSCFEAWKLWSRSI
jgi:hypothetical protein